MKTMGFSAWVIAAAVAAAPLWAAAEADIDRAGEQTVASAAALSDLNLGWLERQSLSDQWGRDPFAAPRRPSPNALGAAPSTVPDLHLSAIIYGEGRGLAIINNKILRKGDQVGDREIVDILRDRVVLRDAAGEQELRVDAFTR